MKRVLLVLAVPVGLVLLAAVVGIFLPREHTATCRVRLRTAAPAVFELLTAVEGYPAWRPEVKAARRREPLDGKDAFVEETGDGPRTYAIEESVAPVRLVLRIADADLPYGGTWTFTLDPDAGGCTLSVREDGFVDPPLFRALARFVFGHHATLEAYLENLTRKLGEDAPIDRS